MAMKKADVSERIKAANLCVTTPSRIWFFVSPIIPLNQRVWTARLRTGQWKSTMINLQSAHAPFYGLGLPAKFWPTALVHLAYLHNRLVHTKTGKTPFKGNFGEKLDISSLKLFGSRVCVRRTRA